MTASDTTAPRYRTLPPERAQYELETEILERWKEEHLFEQTVERNVGHTPYIFFDGPPTANGRPGIHHIFARTIKDLFCRHRAMRGYWVPRKAGWDTHGLPVEIEVEKQLPERLATERGMSPEEIATISGKQLIEAYGVEAFNRLCRESVWKYKGEWERMVERVGHWQDYSNPYVTYTNDYVESVWWALKTLYERGWLSRGHKILPYCPRCGTALSSHEVALGYQEDTDPSVYIALDLEPGPDALRRRILVWTTTPWTLVSNTALAVHPDLDYVEVRKKTGTEWTLLLAEARAAAVLGAEWRERWEIVRRVRGAELVGLRYRRPLDWVDYPAGNHEVIVGEEFVSAEDGSGIVHMSPAFGADDYAAGQRHGLAFLQPVNPRGEFPAEMPLVGGMFVKAADPLIIEELKRRDLLWKAGTIEHQYPHCWRCGTPLLYYARASWFIRTSEYKNDMLARNAQVEWHSPEIGTGRFGAWLENNIDWAISRDRYWGSTLPVWLCDETAEHIEVIGSYAELAEKVGRELGSDFDPHKPFVDQYAWPCAKCGGTMHRVPEVIDTWFDSGAMSFAQWHYPFENREETARQYPADFIAEGVDQTRGWFYSLLAIAAGLGDALPNNAAASAAPFRSVVVNDLVLDGDGVKMSKSKGNVVDPWVVLPRHGADAVRLFLLSSSQVWVPRRFDEQSMRESVGRFLITLKSVYGFFALYANFGWSSGVDVPSVAERPAVDRWVLSRLATVERDVDRMLGDYDATSATRLLMGFVSDDVSNWYVRLNRGRFYDVESADSRAAFSTLHEVLLVTCRLLAPLAPFVSDWLHRELTGDSVHLAPYVRSDAAPIDEGLERAMAEVRVLSTLGRAAREEAGIKVRQPLSRMVCVVPTGLGPQVEALLPLLAAELNVKAVTLANSADSLVTLEAKPNFRSLGKRFGKATPLAAQAVATLTSETLRAFEHGEPVAVSVEGESHLLVPDDVSIVRRAAGDLVVQESEGSFAAIDPSLTTELRQEGIAREVVSRVQRLRKESKLIVSDRIRLAVRGDAEVEQAVRAHADWIAAETLATTVEVGAADDGFETAQQVDLDGLSCQVALTKEG